ncbi:hypothetical protein [Oharaeibacter diazotrophicus]|uniref:hypothetical protein n=1 Tax=Oharaeibacter diazotrophicus TaxID=1920512 RepID=UPI000F81ACD0|nr:hypothetical protein [Oharaeibacter diazotrophicus]
MSLSLFPSAGYAASQCVKPSEARTLTKGDGIPALDIDCRNDDCRISVFVGGRAVYNNRTKSKEICRHDLAFYFEGGDKKNCATTIKSVLIKFNTENRSDRLSINYSDRLEYPGETCFEPELPQFDDESTVIVEIFDRFHVLLILGTGY